MTSKFIRVWHLSFIQEVLGSNIKLETTYLTCKEVITWGVDFNGNGNNGNYTKSNETLVLLFIHWALVPEI
jgi:hypothetical protein